LDTPIKPARQYLALQQAWLALLIEQYQLVGMHHSARWEGDTHRHRLVEACDTAAFLNQERER